MYHRPNKEKEGPKLSFRETMVLFAAFFQLLFPRARVLFGAISGVTILFMFWLR